MAEKSSISWTDFTFNPWIGCQKVSPACANCYAERDFDHRYGKAKWGPNGTRVVTADANWRNPLKWNSEYAKQRQEIWENHGPTLRRPRVFCASIADVFEDWGGFIHDHHGHVCFISEQTGETCSIHPATTSKLLLSDPQKLWRTMTMDDVRARLFKLIDATPNLDWLLLTKRPENIRLMWPVARTCIPEAIKYGENFRENVWLGTSVENQEYADKRIPELLKCRDLSPVLFLSCEPLLGPLDLTMIATNPPYEGIDSLGGQCFDYVAQETRENEKLDWIIVGGESGPGARPTHPDWFTSLRDQCRFANVPFHFKQWGEFVPADSEQLSFLDHDTKTVLPWHDKPGSDDTPMTRIGVKKAGRLLDGIEHNEFPEPRKSNG